MQRKYVKLNIISALLTLALIVSAVTAMKFFEGTRYCYISAFVIIIAACVPFFISFERRKPSARELVALASMCAIAVASRAAFFAIPTVKPICAVIIITAACFGALDLTALGTALLAAVLSVLFFYSFAVLCMMFTGQILAAPVFYGTLNFLAVGMEYLVRTFAGNFLYGYSGYSAPETFAFLSPAWELV